jgi:hypothetical protein
MGKAEHGAAQRHRGRHHHGAQDDVQVLRAEQFGIGLQRELRFIRPENSSIE